MSALGASDVGRWRATLCARVESLNSGHDPDWSALARFCRSLPSATLALAIDPPDARLGQGLIGDLLATAIRWQAPPKRRQRWYAAIRDALSAGFDPDVPGGPMNSDAAGCLSEALAAENGDGLLSRRLMRRVDELMDGCAPWSALWRQRLATDFPELGGYWASRQAMSLDEVLTGQGARPARQPRL